MKLIILIISIWWLLGVCGYFIMRQGNLVEFEKCLGKKVAWGNKDVVLGLIYTIQGPIVILHALYMCGKNCFCKRKGE